MASTLMGKSTKYGYVEIQEGDGKYWLYVAGVLKQFSSDLATIKNIYDSY